MQVQTINNSPNFGTLRISHSPEMKTAKRILKQNFPDYYNSLMSDCEKALKGTKYFDGFLDIENGKLVLRLQHSKNFVWPGEEYGAISIGTKNNLYPKLHRDSTRIEFETSDGKWLRLKKLDGNERVVRYTVRDCIRYGEWSDKATARQANLIKMLDDSMQDYTDNN
jgi:hypothetical protein